MLRSSCAIETPVCVMCGAVRPSALTPQPFLCASAYCAARYASLPAAQTCAVCRVPLTLVQLAQGMCGHAACRDARLLAQAREGLRQRREALAAAAAARRDRAAAADGLSMREAATYLVAIVPRNEDTPTPLPSARREAFVARLRRSLAEARERRERGDTPVPKTMVRPLVNGRSAAEEEAEVMVLGAACGVCRGNCCKQGGDHAFNTADTMMHYLDEHPTHDDETIVARYDALIPSHSLSQGCVFQQTTGCALPRELRSDVCNRFYCEYVSVLRNQYGPGDKVRAYVVHQDVDELYGGVLVDIPIPRTPI